MTVTPTREHFENVLNVAAILLTPAPNSTFTWDELYTEFKDTWGPGHPDEQTVKDVLQGMKFLKKHQDGKYSVV